MGDFFMAYHKRLKLLAVLFLLCKKNTRVTSKKKAVRGEPSVSKVVL